MLPEQAFECVSRSWRGEPGRFYAPVGNIALGKGCICSESVMALFDPARGLYRTAVGTAYILTHECDVDAENERPYNDDLLLCPLIGLEVFVEQYLEDHGPANLPNFLGNLGARRISRLVYLPPIAGLFAFGAVMFLNQITHARAEVVRDRGALVCAVTAFGLREVEFALENHLLRPKADRLAFMPGDWEAEPAGLE